MYLCSALSCTLHGHGHKRIQGTKESNNCTNVTTLKHAYALPSYTNAKATYKRTNLEACTHLATYTTHKSNKHTDLEACISLAILLIIAMPVAMPPRAIGSTLVIQVCCLIFRQVHVCMQQTDLHRFQCVALPYHQNLAACTCCLKFAAYPTSKHVLACCTQI